MAGLQDLLEAYKNYQGVQNWKLGQQMNRVPGAEEAMDLWGGWDTGGLAGAIKTYHGSPRAEPFTQFNDEYIRTGVYGKGHYFAENPKEAKKYAESKGRMFKEGQPQHSIYEVSLEWPDAGRESVDPLSPEHFFQFGRMLKNQPPHVRKALEEIAQENPNIADDYIQFLAKHGSPGWTLKDLMAQSPEMLIKYGEGFEPLMYEKGVPGVSFQDQVSRGKAGPTRNYAVFGSDVPRIISHNKPSVLDMLWPKK